MKHKILTPALSVAAVLCLTLGLAACGGDAPEQDGDAVHHHTYTVDNVCSGCGDKWEYTEGLQYELCEGVEGFLDAHEVGYLVQAPDEGGLTGDIVIPYGYNGKWVTTIGNGGFCDLPDVTSIVIPESIVCIMSDAFIDCTSLTSIVIPDSVVSIGEDILSGCTALRSVKIGSNVEEIGKSAFFGCTALTDIELPDSAIVIEKRAFYNTAYYNDPSNWDESGVLYVGNHLIKAKGMPEGSYAVRAGTKTIADQAFMNENYPEKEEYSYSMTSISLPEGLLSIGDGAFYDCNALADITIPDSVIRIQEDFGNTAYYQDQSHWEDGKALYIGNHLVKAKELSGSYAVRTGTKCIADGAFSNCKELSAVNLPDSVVSIGESAFNGCSALGNITIPDGVKILRYRTFDGCSSLESIKLGSGLEAIDWCAFEGCKALKGLTIPKNVTKLGYILFLYCDALETLEVEAGNKVFRSEGNCIISIERNAVIQGCKTSTIPNGVKEIGGMAFSECVSPENIVLPDSVTEIGVDAFLYCSSLKSIVIPNGVTKIMSYTFAGCSSLTDVTIGSGVTEIEDAAFDYCENLTSVTFADPNGWVLHRYNSTSDTTSDEAVSAEILSDPATAATYFVESFSGSSSCSWTKTKE